MSTISLTLPSDLLLPIVANTPLNLSEFSTLCLLAKESKKRVLPLVSLLVLSQPAKLTRLLALCGGYSFLPRLSGHLSIDVLAEVVPWSQLRYQHLTIYLECQLRTQPLYLTSLFKLAAEDSSCSLSLYDSKYMLMAEAKEGYVSRNLYFDCSAGIGAYCWERDLRLTKILVRDLSDIRVGDYQAFWFQASFLEFRSALTMMTAEILSELRNIRSVRPQYITIEALRKFSKIEVLGPNVIVTNESMSEELDCPSLTNLNVSVLTRGDEEWALKQGLPVTLYTPRALIPLFRQKYQDDKRVVGIAPLD